MSTDKPFDAFLAVTFEGDTVEQLIQLRTPSPDDLPPCFHVTASVDLHITVGYIKRINNQDLGKLLDLLKPISDFNSFDINIEKTGSFGYGRNQGKYLGACIMDTSGELKRLRDIANSWLMASTSYEFTNSGQFNPHITLQRFYGEISEERRAELTQGFLKQDILPITVKVRNFALMRRIPGVEHYQTLEVYPLHGKIV